MVTRGIVLRKTDHGENHQLVTFYTKDLGKFTGLAKSLKKSISKQASHLDVFKMVDFLIVAGKNYPIITSAQSVEDFPYLRQSLLKNAAGFFLLESFHRLVYDYEKDPALWNFLYRALSRLDQGTDTIKDMQNLLGDFKQQLTTILGYAAIFDEKELDNFLFSLSPKPFWSLRFFHSLATVNHYE